MNKHDYFRNLQYPEEKYFLQLRNIPISEIFDPLEGYCKIKKISESEETLLPHHLFDEFLESLRAKGIPVSPPEWLHFMKIVSIKAQEVNTLTLGSFFSLLRLYAQTTLIKDKAYYFLFHEAFDEYFMRIKKVLALEMEAEKRFQEKKILQQITNTTQKSIHKVINTNSEQNSTIETKGMENLDSQYKEGAETADKEALLNSLKKRFKEEHTKVESKSDFVQKEQNINDEIQTNPKETKDSLGIKDVNKDLNTGEDEHDDNEQQHGGNDQHNDILQNIDKSKQGGGNEKDADNGKSQGGNNQNNQSEENKGKGGNNQNNQSLEQKNENFHGGGHLKFTKSIERTEKNWVSPPTEIQIVQMKKEAKKVDSRRKYEKRPDKSSTKNIVRTLRKIIISSSEIKSNKLDIKQTVKNIAKKSYSFEFSHERKKQQELVLFIDVGGPVDIRRHIIDEVTESMTKGLSKLEIYLFHNNIYGYVRPYDKKNARSSSFAKPNSLLNVKDIVNHRKKVIIYGDAEMSHYEIESDKYPPLDNKEKISKYGMSGTDCLAFIKKKAKSTVWLNPILQKSWNHSNKSGSLSTVKDIIPMYDLSVGGMEDAIMLLMQKR